VLHNRVGAFSSARAARVWHSAARAQDPRAAWLRPGQQKSLQRRRHVTTVRAVQMPRDPEPPGRVHVRRADAVDLDALLALETRVFRSDLISRAQYRRHIDSDSALVLVATQTGTLLGSVVVFFRRGSRNARLYSLASAPEARGRGVGAALLRAAEQAARQRRCRGMRLEVRSSNRAAQRLYETRGYARGGVHRGYYEDGADALRYAKALD
jgi:ribosomal protein S18 acetylase RimI-like enzyme